MAQITAVGSPFAVGGAGLRSETHDRTQRQKGRGQIESCHAHTIQDLQAFGEFSTPTGRNSARARKRSGRKGDIGGAPAAPEGSAPVVAVQAPAVALRQ